MGYFNSYGQWIDTGVPTTAPGAFTTNNTTTPNAYSRQPVNSAWGGGSIQQPQFSIVSIQGRPIAEDYPVAPGAKVMMIDANEMVAYIKERNPQGALLPFLTYDLVLRDDQPKQEQAAMAPVIDYDKIRDIVKEEVDKTFKGKQKNYKEAK